LSNDTSVGSDQTTERDDDDDDSLERCKPEEPYPIEINTISRRRKTGHKG